MPTITVVLCGVGGQGTILAADLLAHAALAAGKDVKVSEIHGMAQRGGSVSTVVRIGDEVHSMVSDAHAADIIVSFETTEALRNLYQLKDDGVLIVNDLAIKPMSVLNGSASMPQNAQQRLLECGALLMPAEDIAQKKGNVKASNVVLLGALSTFLDFPTDAWTSTISARVPEKTIDVNLEAFKAGKAYIQAQRS